MIFKFALHFKDTVARFLDIEHTSVADTSDERCFLDGHYIDVPRFFDDADGTSDMGTSYLKCYNM